jgi:tight adherence protein B
MPPDGAALLLLGWSLIMAFLGIITLLRGSAQKAALADRGRMGDDERVSERFSIALDARVRRTQSGRRLARWLDGTGTGMRAGDFILLVLCGAFALSMVLALILAPLAGTIVALIAVIVAARSWGEWQRGKRREAFIGQLPDLARVLSNGASAGLSLAGAIELAAREMPEPAGGEMRTIVEQMRVGQPVDAALEALRERLPSREVAVLMSTLVIQHRAGGDTVRALQELGSTLDARKDLLREVKTLMSGSVANSWIVAGIGVASLLLVNLIQPGMLREMTSNVIGLAALLVAGMLWTLALVMIRRATKVDM